MILEYVIIQTLRFFIPALYWMLFRILGLGYKDKKHLIIGFTIFCIYTLIVPFSLIQLLGYRPYSKIWPLVAPLSNFIVLYLSSDRFLKTAFLHMISVNIMITVNIFSNTLRHTLHWSELKTMLFLIPLYTCLLFLSVRFFAKPLRFMADHIHSGWGYLIFIPIASMAAVICITAYSDVYFGDDPLLMASLVFIIEAIFFCFICVLYKNIREIKTLSEKEIDNELLRISADSMKQQIDLTQREYRIAMQNVEQVRRMRHDMNHHLSVLFSLIDMGELAEAQKYIEGITEQIPSKSLTDKNLLTVSFLSKYKRLCENESILFSSEIAFDEDQISDKIGLGTVLGNALQNAYEAAGKAFEHNRFIRVICKQVRGHLVIIIRNGYNGKLNEDYKTTKTEGMHGLGLLSIRQTIEKHNGFMEISHTDSEFTLKLILNLEPEKDPTPIPAYSVFSQEK